MITASKRSCAMFLESFQVIREGYDEDREHSTPSSKMLEDQCKLVDFKANHLEQDLFKVNLIQINCQSVK